MYLDAVKAWFEAVDVEDSQQVKPCTEEEVRSLEKDLGLLLPAVYKEFLLWMGQRDNRAKEEIHMQPYHIFPDEMMKELPGYVSKEHLGPMFGRASDHCQVLASLKSAEASRELRVAISLGV